MYLEFFNGKTIRRSIKSLSNQWSILFAFHLRLIWIL
jgi:hypothetical protein